ncbi:hypothetical protein A2876_01145 [Candidatus Amesbacteria bacterium RIFCSPHIGHO2_01_FULL_48_32b]|uniref:Uncharacterized protein n=1 Tax=Candidatus Amesbacteria bacterium RIFCSPHIGHO2_01_FULL_48_32b TaxID=1797253 RepID=A0A1F4YGL6_9BACT|nr:MAG: hypothetical protein A2876_01145 [Candidatus Amesbacteria bacterium RIFCSPHIGHO2_01_FULL_48_32b]
MRQVTKLQKFVGATAALGGLLAVSPLSVLAQINKVNITVPGQFTSVATWDLSRVIGAAVNLVLVAAGVMAFLYLLIGGIQWLMAGGDKEGTEKARKRITAALIGLVIVFSVFALFALVQAFLGLDLLSLNITNI